MGGLSHLTMCKLERVTVIMEHFEDRKSIKHARSTNTLVCLVSICLKHRQVAETSHAFLFSDTDTNKETFTPKTFRTQVTSPPSGRHGVALAGFDCIVEYILPLSYCIRQFHRLQVCGHSRSSLMHVHLAPQDTIARH